MRRIAVFDSSNDLIGTLELLLRDAGVEPCVACLEDFILGKLDMRTFLLDHNPQVIIYDIPYPYTEHCRYLDALMEQGLFIGREVILTTTNPKVVKELDGCRKVQLLIGKPFAFDQLLVLIQSAS